MKNSLMGEVGSDLNGEMYVLWEMVAVVGSLAGCDLVYHTGGTESPFLSHGEKWMEKLDVQA